MIVRVQIPPLPPNHKCHTNILSIQIQATANLAALEPKTQLLLCEFVDRISDLPLSRQHQIHFELRYAFTEMLDSDI